MTTVSFLLRIMMRSCVSARRAAGFGAVILLIPMLEAQAKSEVEFIVSPAVEEITFDPNAPEKDRVLKITCTVTNSGTESKWFPSGSDSVTAVPLADYRWWKRPPFRNENRKPASSPDPEEATRLDPGESLQGTVKFELSSCRKGAVVFFRPGQGSEKSPDFGLFPGRTLHLVFRHAFSSRKPAEWPGTVFSNFLEIKLPGKPEEDRENSAASILSIKTLSNPDLEFSLETGKIDAVPPPPGQTRRAPTNYYPVEYSLSNRSKSRMTVISAYQSLRPFLITADGTSVDLDSGADHFRRIAPDDFATIQAGKSLRKTFPISAYPRSENSKVGFGYENVSGTMSWSAIDPGRYFLVFRYWPPDSVETYLDPDDAGKIPDAWWSGTAFSNFVEITFSRTEAEGS